MEVVQVKVGEMTAMETRRWQQLRNKCRKIWMIESNANGAIGSLLKRLAKDICLIVNRSIRPISSNKEVVNHRFLPKEVLKQAL